MRLFDAIDASASGLTAQRLRLEIISSNIANAETTRTPTGTPYRRRVPLYAPRDGYGSFATFLRNRILHGNETVAGPFNGVRVVGIMDDVSPFKLKYDPGHPDADERGYVRLPNVDVITEMVDMIDATRAYEANVTAIQAAKSMALKALEIGR